MRPCGYSRQKDIACSAVVANMGTAADAHAAAARTVEHFDGIDIDRVNNAATNPIPGPLQQATDEAFEKIFGVNVKGPLELCRTAHTVMAQRGGYRSSIFRASVVCRPRPVSDYTA